MNKRTCIARLRLMSLGMALWASAFGAEAQQEPTVRVEKIEVTGSHIKRVDTETGLPVTTITRSEIEKSGATTAEELLATISATWLQSEAPSTTAR